MGKKNNISSNLQTYRVNKEIYIEGSPMVRLVKEDGSNEVCHISQAREMAKEAELDLIEINGKVTPPILKIGDYSKFLYEAKQRLKKQQHSAKPVKEVQLSVSIASNDMQTKAKNARKFILDGSKVKVVLTMRGREKARREENKKSLFEFIEMLEDVAVPESLPKDEGESKTIVILKAKNSVKKS
jgi:translation initiation factor IF-3